MERIAIDRIMADVRERLHLSKESEYEVLAELRTHLEDAAAEAERRGEDEQAALERAAAQFGIEEASAELQEVHSSRESIDAIAATALPVLFALILRWLVYAPDGSALDWPHLLARPALWVVAVAALLIPFLIFRRWRYALVGWGFFWLVTVVFVVFPGIQQW